MKKLILFFIILLLAVGAGILMHTHPAYVFISMGHVSVQASLWFAIIALIVSIFFVFLIIKVLKEIYDIPARLHHLITEHRERKSHVLTQKALRALVEARWDRCEIYFSKSAKKQSSPFFHYVGAAQAAFEQNKVEMAARYLQKAQKFAKPSDVFVLETLRARWQLCAKDYQQALAILTVLQKISPDHPFVLTGLKEVYMATKNWPKLYELLPQLRKHTLLDPVALDALEQQVLKERLCQAGQTKLFAVLEKTWKEIPKKWRDNSSLLAVYVHYLMEQNQHEEAEKLLKVALKKARDAVLLKEYAVLDSRDPVKQLARAESWLKQDEQNPDLLLCLGKLCAKHRLWGKAKTYLETSLKHKSYPDTYPILGQVLEHLDQKHAALDCYRKGLGL